jgi:orotate phosphoribosyltransferase
MYPMQESQILQEFTAAEAILKGHFILSSGRHSDTYLQCARVLMLPSRAEKLCHALAEKLRAEIDITAIDLVVAPAMGGVIVGYEMARQLGKPSIFCERQEGVFTFRRGFDMPQGAKVLVVEDVVTTGLSSKETFHTIETAGGKVVAECALIDRSNGSANLGVPLVTLLKLEVPSYAPEEIPAALQKIPAIKPGSRWLQEKASATQ